MKLLMKQRVFSWTDTYDVYDEAGNKKYFVKAELFRLGHQIHVFDVSGNEIGMIKQRLFTLLPSFDIVISGTVPLKYARLNCSPHTHHNPRRGNLPHNAIRYNQFHNAV